ncbi:MAG: OmpA family protein [Bacteroidia bacterium]|nr:OmpA family protein [Bacteroidia bacterium]
MFKSTHPITRIFWVTLVIGVLVYQMSKTEYPGTDAVIEDARTYSYSDTYEEGNACVFPAIFFETNSSKLELESMASLDEIAQRMMRNPQMRLEISGLQGHSENHGLAEDREDAIYKYLTRNYNFLPNRLVRSDNDANVFEKPRKDDRLEYRGHTSRHESFDQNGHHYEFHYYNSSSCKNKRRNSHSNKSHCKQSRKSCHKQKEVKKTHRAVYITCLD